MRGRLPPWQPPSRVALCQEGRRLLEPSPPAEKLGQRRGAVLAWGGSGWQILPSPHPGNPSGDDVFRGVDVDSSGSGWAVGYYLINEFPDTITRAFIAECC